MDSSSSSYMKDPKHLKSTNSSQPSQPSQQSHLSNRIPVKVANASKKDIMHGLITPKGLTRALNNSQGGSYSKKLKKRSSSHKRKGKKSKSHRSKTCKYKH